MSNRMEEIEKEIKILGTNIILNLRPRKIVDKESFSKLFNLIRELRNLIRDDDYINKNIARMLFSYYVQIENEYNRANDEKKEQILNELVTLKLLILEMYYDSTLT